MAAILKATHGLTALRIALPVWEAQAVLSLTLEDHADGGRILGEWKFPLEPEECAELAAAERLKARLGEIADELIMLMKLSTDVETPLWIHLVRPYGYCGAVDWEGLLQPRLQRPVLRLPDFLERSHEDPGTLDIALCCDPGDTAPERCAGLLDRAIEAGLAAPRDQVQIHVFTTSAVRKRLAPHEASRVQVHAPSPSQAEAGHLAPRCWLTWITGAMAGAALDAIHFVVPAEEQLGRGALRLSDNPCDDGGQTCISRVERAQLAEFLGRTGAWAAMFTAPDADTDLAMRYFADGLAQVRPGPHLMVSAASIGAGALAEAYRFLFSPEALAPPSQGLDMIYCQPALVANSAAVNLGVDSAWRQTKSLAPEFFTRKAATMTKLDGAAATTPVWLSATQRFVEQAAMERDRQELFLRQADVSADHAQAIHQANTVVDQTLSDIQSILDDERFKVGDGS